MFSYHEYEKINEEDRPLNIYVSGSKVVDKRRMYNYDYIGQLTMTMPFGCNCFIKILMPGVILSRKIWQSTECVRRA